MPPLAALSVADGAACPESRHGMPCYTELAALSVAEVAACLRKIVRACLSAAILMFAENLKEIVSVVRLR